MTRSGVEHDSEVTEPGDRDNPQETAGGEPAAPLHPEAPVAFLLDSGGKPDDIGGRSDCVLSLREAASGLTVKDLERRLAGRLLVVDARIGGFGDGLLDAGKGKPVPTAEDNWGRAEAWDGAVPGGAGTAGLRRFGCAWRVTTSGTGWRPSRGWRPRRTGQRSRCVARVVGGAVPCLGGGPDP